MGRGTGAAHKLSRLALGTTPDDALLQQRIARFCLIAFLFSLGFFVADHIVQFDGTLGPSDYGHLAGSGLLLGGWLLTRGRRPLDHQLLLVIDATMVTISCAAWALMAYQGRSMHEVNNATLATVFTVLARAVIVPSAPVHSFVVSLAGSTPVPIVAGFVATMAGAVPASETPALSVSRTILWAAMTTVGATVTSAVIYGLRQKVRSARQLGQYTLERKIGAGGMGEVYKANHAMLRRPTAIKLINRAESSENQLVRFEQEVQLTSHLSHPNTVRIYDYGRTPDGVFYYAMEYLEGFTLNRLVQEHGPMPAGRAIYLLRQVCDALEEAHATGLIHRDIKPENIMVCQRGGNSDFIKVLDFGLVKQVMGDYASVTDANVLLGTPHYMAPEAIKSAKDVNARSDLYAVGCVAHYLLTGEHVFEADSLVEICGHHLHSEPEPPSGRSGRALSPDLDAIVLSCLAKSPEERPASARALAGQLGQCDNANAWDGDLAKAWWADIAAGGGELVTSEITVPISQRTLAIDLTLRER